MINEFSISFVFLPYFVRKQCPYWVLIIEFIKRRDWRFPWCIMHLNPVVSFFGSSVNSVRKPILKRFPTCAIFYLRTSISHRRFRYCEFNTSYPILSRSHPDTKYLNERCFRHVYLIEVPAAWLCVHLSSLNINIHS